VEGIPRSQRLPFYLGIAIAFAAMLFIGRVGIAGFGAMATVSLILMTPASVTSFQRKRAFHGRAYVVYMVAFYAVVVACGVIGLVVSAHIETVALVGFGVLFVFVIFGRRFNNR
jgi:hypothetical protein